MPLISIIIPVFNGERTLEKCLNSITKIDYPDEDFEVIVVDNNSTDKTKQIISQFPFRYLLEKKPGAAAARNLGVKFAKGEILAFTDADVCVASDWLSKIAETYNKYPQVDGIQGYSGGINHNIWAEFFQVHYERHYFPSIAKQKSGIKDIDTKNFSIKKSKFLAVGGFNEEYIRAEDSDLGMRIFAGGYNIVYIPEVRVYHINPCDLCHQILIKEIEFKFRFKSFMSFDKKVQKALHPHYFKGYYKLIYSNDYVTKRYIRPLIEMLLGISIKVLLRSLLLFNYFGFKHSLYPIYSISIRAAIFKGKINSVMNR